MRARRPAAALALIPALFLTLVAGEAVRAQGLVATGDSGEPVEINADEGIEWRRDEKVYIAIGNARAARGDVELFGDKLTAFYRDTESGGTEIYRVEAHGNVRVVSPSESVYGDEGFYEVDQGLAVMTGDNLKLETKDDVITARDALEYWEKDQKAIARGDAVAIREDKRLMADILTAHFEPDADGKLVIQTVDAEGNVRISTPTDYISSKRGVYHIDSELAELFGDVKITRDQNQLNGGYAEINLATGVSRLLANAPGSSGDGKVRGLLVPEKADSSGGGS
jgi:lipopolysaccharide export system protein LptA